MGKTREDLESAWWERWWAQDFSWAGLGTKPVGQNADTTHGGFHGEQTLRDYWRRHAKTGAVRNDASLEAAGDLVRAPDGSLWHVAHVPLVWADGTPARTAAGSSVPRLSRAAILARLSAATGTSVNSLCDAEATDGRAQFQGVVFDAPLELKPAEQMAPAVLDWAWLPDWTATRVSHPAGFRCCNALFSGDCRFDSATFRRNSNFDSATFSCLVDFDKTTFSGDACFLSVNVVGSASFRNVSFTEIADFAGARFLSSVDFDSTRFARSARFMSVVFFGPTSFFRTSFSGDVIFNGAAFEDKARFDSVEFSGDAQLMDVKFAAETRFVSATFSHLAIFAYTKFAESVLFHNATFVGDASFLKASFAGDAAFTRATFSDLVNFDAAIFSGNAAFQSVNFVGDVSFGEAGFSGNARFDNATFSRYVSFGSATFAADASFNRITVSGDAGFGGARFEKLLTFSGARFEEFCFFGPAAVTWPEAAEHWHRAFDKAEFRRTVSFEGSGLRVLAAFDGIRVAAEASLHLDDESDDMSLKAFQDELTAALAAALHDVKRINETREMAGLRLFKPSMILHFEEDRRLKELERGCRALVVEMEKLRDKTRAQLFYRFEIAARRRQNETSWPEKATSWLYEKLGDYGAAIGRPLIWLLLSIPLGAVVYGGALWLNRDALCAPYAGEPPKHPARSFCEALDSGALRELGWGAATFSAQRVLPFGAWDVKAEEPEKNDAVRVLLLGEGDTAFSFGIRLLATLQSVFALAMAFLAGVAIRRRFQLD